MGRSSDDIMKAAADLEGHQGDGAEVFARKQADAARLAGNADEALRWEEIADDLHALHMINRPLQSFEGSIDRRR